MFESLPEETLLQILLELDIRDILRCSSVCRYLHVLISNSTMVQYKVELGIAGFIDGDPTSEILTVSNRLKSLRTFERNWSRLKFQRKTRQVMPGIFRSAYDLIEGVAAFGYSGGDVPFSGMWFAELPSFANNYLKKQWEHSDIGVNIRDFTLDPSQDLLTLISVPTPTITNRNDYLLQIHIRSLTTGLPHVESHSPILSCYATLRRGEFSWGFFIRIMGPFVGLMTYPSMAPWMWDSTDSNHLYIWSWKTGALVAMLVVPCHEARIESFHFLSLRYIAISQYHRSLPEGSNSSLAVYEIPDETLTLKLLRTYRLPTIRPGMMISSMIIRSESSPQYHTHSPSMSPRRPFLIDSASSLLTVRMEVIDIVQRTRSQRVMIFLQASTLLNYFPSAKLSSDEIEIPWRLWVPHKTRIFEDFGDHFTWLCDTYGQRYVRLAPSLEPPEIEGIQEESHSNFLWVYDFNPLSVRKAQSSVTKENLVDSPASSFQWIIDELKPTTVPATSTLFTAEVQTALPYCVTRTATRYELEGVMMYTDGIVGTIQAGSRLDDQQMDEDGLVILSI